MRFSIIGGTRPGLPQNPPKSTLYAYVHKLAETMGGRPDRVYTSYDLMRSHGPRRD